MITRLPWFRRRLRFREVPGPAARTYSEPTPTGCSLSAVDDIVRENSEKLAGLLQGRKDWRREAQDGEELWCFGVAGAGRLVIAPEMDGFLVYRADEDRSWVIPRIESVEEWLDEHEAEHAGLTPLQEEFKKALERGEPGTSDT
jgi:hypothetical protein